MGAPTIESSRVHHVSLEEPCHHSTSREQRLVSTHPSKTFFLDLALEHRVATLLFVFVQRSEGMLRLSLLRTEPSPDLKHLGVRWLLLFIVLFRASCLSVVFFEDYCIADISMVELLLVTLFLVVVA